MAFNDPFNSAPGTNIFEAAQQRGQQQQPTSPMPNGFDQQPPTPSRAVPGHQVSNGGAGPMPEPQAQQMPEGSSPLDKYAKIAQTEIVKPTADDKKVERQPDITDALKSLTFDDVHKNYSTQNLLGNLDKAQVKQVLESGDPDAFIDILQTVARNAAAAATVGSTRLHTASAEAYAERLRSEIPQHLKQTQIANLWQGNGDAVLNRPEVAPLRAAATDMFAKQYPQATPEQIKTMTLEYFRDLYSVGFNTQQEESEAKRAAASSDKKSTMAEFFKDL